MDAFALIAQRFELRKYKAACNAPGCAEQPTVEAQVTETAGFQTRQLAALFLLAATLAKQAGRLSAAEEEEHLAALRHLPVAVGKVLALEPQIEAWAQHFAPKRHALFLGRGHQGWDRPGERGDFEDHLFRPAGGVTGHGGA